MSPKHSSRRLSLKPALNSLIIKIFLLPPLTTSTPLKVSFFKVHKYKAILFVCAFDQLFLTETLQLNQFMAHAKNKSGHNCQITIQLLRFCFLSKRPLDWQTDVIIHIVAKNFFMAVTADFPTIYMATQSDLWVI